jgi:hypothetical protein
MNHNERAFDHLLQQRLESIQPPLREGRWELMQQMLQDLDTPNPFDAALANQLHATEPNLQVSQWERMEQELEFDELVHGSTSRTNEEELAWKLQHLQARYNPAHWERLAHLLDVRTLYYPGILRSKLVELSAVLLFLLFFLHQYQPTAPSELQAFAASEPVSATSLATADVGSSASDLTSDVLVPPSSSIPAFAQAAAQTSLQIPIDAHSQEQPSEPSESLENLVNLPQETTQVAGQIASETIVTNQLPTPELSPLPREQTTTLALAPLALKPTPHWYLSMAASANRNVIQTPFDPAFQTAPLRHGSYGYSSGLSLSRKTGQTELLTGIWHSTIAYRPPVPVQQFGTFDFLVIESFEGIHLDLLQVPLQVNYHFRKSPRKWNAYAHAGLQASFILDAVYDIRRTVIQAQGKPRDKNDSEKLKSRLDRKEFPKGLTAGGQLSNNFFLSISAGAGVERHLNDRWVLFAQPTYTRQLSANGIGPNNDRLHNWSMLVGSRVLIR